MDPFQKLFENRTSGSASLLGQFINLLRREASTNARNWSSTLNHRLEDARIHWDQFQIIHHFVSEASPYEEKAALFLEFINDYESRWGDQLVENWYTYLNAAAPFTEEEKTIFLHSNSWSIASTLTLAKEKGASFKIIQTLSAPMNEGLIQGDAIASLGVSVRIVPDAMSSWGVGQSDIVLLGSDAVFPQAFSNKTGSLTICLAASHFKTPVYVLTDSRKICREHPRKQDSQRGSEVFDTKGHAQLESVNYYFEDVPLRLVTAFVTENGSIVPNQMEAVISNTLKERVKSS